jgi:ribosomal protein L40E
MFERKKKCSTCGFVLPEAANYCRRCGTAANGLKAHVYESSEICLEYRENRKKILLGHTFFTITITERQEGGATGTWRMEMDVQREYNLKVGESTEYCDRQNHFYRLTLTASHGSERTFRLEDIRIEKEKS